jgi:hypothetical protein
MIFTSPLNIGITFFSNIYLKYILQIRKEVKRNKIFAPL